jgi:hypothetical protein
MYLLESGGFAHGSGEINLGVQTFCFILRPMLFFVVLCG